MAPRYQPWRGLRLRLQLLLALAGFGLGLSISCAAHEKAAVDASPGLFRAWGEECRIHHPCPRKRALPLCPKDKATTPPSPPAPAPGNVRSYAIAGRLYFEPLETTTMSCERRFWTSDCCNDVYKTAVLISDDGARRLLIDVGCSGDDSRLCCDIEPRGQKLMATFDARFECSDETGICQWSDPNLADLCEIPSAILPTP
jgi:hypothetical protein